MPDDFMDKSVTFTPDAILSAMREFYQNLVTNPNLKTLKKQMAAALISGSLLMPNAAFAEGFPSGQITYTKFLEGVNTHAIERVRVAADGRTAEFLTNEGTRGSVNLFNDPNLFKLLQDNQVDLSVMPPDQAGAALFSILNTLAFPLILFGGIFLLNRNRMGGAGGPMDPSNPFMMGKSKARI
jgi:ATP-dependent Zn protease